MKSPKKKPPLSKNNSFLSVVSSNVYASFFSFSQRSSGYFLHIARFLNECPIPMKATMETSIVATRNSKIILAITASFGICTAVFSGITFTHGAPRIVLWFLVFGVITFVGNFAYICIIPKQLLHRSDVRRARMFGLIMVVLGVLAISASVVAISNWGWYFKLSSGSKSDNYYITMDKLALAYNSVLGALQALAAAYIFRVCRKASRYIPPEIGPPV